MKAVQRREKKMQQVAVGDVGDVSDDRLLRPLAVLSN